MKRKTKLVLFGVFVGAAFGIVAGVVIGGIGIAVTGGAFGIIAPVVAIILGALGAMVGASGGLFLDLILRKTIDRQNG